MDVVKTVSMLFVFRGQLLCTLGSTKVDQNVPCLSAISEDYSPIPVCEEIHAAAGEDKTRREGDRNAIRSNMYQFVKPQASGLTSRYIIIY